MKIHWNMRVPSTLEEACIIGCLDKGQELYTEITETWGRIPAFQKSMQQTIDTAMSNVANHNYTQIVSYFLDQGLRITGILLVGAVESDSTNIFEFLLDHGGILTAEIGMVTPH